MPQCFTHCLYCGSGTEVHHLAVIVNYEITRGLGGRCSWAFSSLVCIRCLSSQLLEDHLWSELLGEVQLYGDETLQRRDCTYVGWDFEFKPIPPCQCSVRDDGQVQRVQQPPKE